jgi:hypothetical protein
MVGHTQLRKLGLRHQQKVICKRRVDTHACCLLCIFYDCVLYFRATLVLCTPFIITVICLNHPFSPYESSLYVNGSKTAIFLVLTGMMNISEDLS